MSSMRTGRGFRHTYKNVRLFVDEEVEGWVSAAYSIAEHRWIDKDSFIYNDLEEAKKSSVAIAEMFLGETLPEFDWEAYGSS